MYEQIEKKIAKLEVIKDILTVCQSYANCYAPDPETGKHESEYQYYRFTAYQDIISILQKQV